MRANYAINPTPELDLRTNRAVLPARVIAALGVSMKSRVVLVVKAANISDPEFEDALSKGIAETFENVTVYKFSPPPNVILASSSSWQAFLGTAADIAGIASFIWLVWENWKASRPRKTRSVNEPFLVIQLNPSTRKYRQIVVKETDASKEEFIEEFAAAVSELQKQEPADEHVTKNPNWIKVTRYGADS